MTVEIFLNLLHAHVKLWKILARRSSSIFRMKPTKSSTQNQIDLFPNFFRPKEKSQRDVKREFDRSINFIGFVFDWCTHYEIVAHVD